MREQDKYFRQVNYFLHILVALYANHVSDRNKLVKVKKLSSCLLLSQF